MARTKNIWLVFKIAINDRTFLLLKAFFSKTFLNEELRNCSLYDSFLVE